MSESPKKKRGAASRAPAKTPAEKKNPASPSKRDISRKLILDATEDLMLKEGYGAVSTRRVAREAGLKAPLVHYYFPTTDDLYIALLERTVNARLAEIDDDAETPPPLAAVWQSYQDVETTGLVVEFMALANHRAAVRKAFARYLEKARKKRAQQFSRVLASTGDNAITPSPEALATVLIAISRSLVMEERMGMAVGHRETLEFLDRWLESLQGPAR